MTQQRTPREWAEYAVAKHYPTMLPSPELLACVEDAVAAAVAEERERLTAVVRRLVEALHCSDARCPECNALWTKGCLEWCQVGPALAAAKEVLGDDSMSNG